MKKIYNMKYIAIILLTFLFMLSDCNNVKIDKELKEINNKLTSYEKEDIEFDTIIDRYEKIYEKIELYKKTDSLGTDTVIQVVADSAFNILDTIFINKLIKNFPCIYESQEYTNENIDSANVLLSKIAPYQDKFEQLNKYESKLNNFVSLVELFNEVKEAKTKIIKEKEGDVLLSKLNDYSTRGFTEQQKENIVNKIIDFENYLLDLMSYYDMLKYKDFYLEKNRPEDAKARLDTNMFELKIFKDEIQKEIENFNK